MGTPMTVNWYHNVMVEVSTEGRRIDPVTFLVTVNLETFQKLLISDKAYFPEMNLS